MLPSSPPPNVASHLTPTQLADAIRQMSDDDWALLTRRSKWFAFHGSRPAEDYRQEAFFRGLSGSRRCPRDMPPVNFLVGTMRSLASADRERIDAMKGSVPIDGMDIADDRVPNEERILQAILDGSLLQRITSALSDDDQLVRYLECRLDGDRGSEAARKLGLSPEELATVQRRFMRRIQTFRSEWVR